MLAKAGRVVKDSDYDIAWLKYLPISRPGVCCMRERSAEGVWMYEGQESERGSFLFRRCQDAPHVVLHTPIIQPWQAESEREGTPARFSLPAATRECLRNSHAYSAATAGTGFSFHVHEEFAQLPRPSRVKRCIRALGHPALSHLARPQGNSKAPAC